MLMLQAGSHSFDPANPQAPNLIFEAFDYRAAGPHMHFLSGTVPQATIAGQTPQVAITQQMASDFGLKVGDDVLGTEFGDHSHSYYPKCVGHLGAQPKRSILEWRDVCSRQLRCGGVPASSHL